MNETKDQILKSMSFDLEFYIPEQFTKRELLALREVSNTWDETNLQQALDITWDLRY